MIDIQGMPVDERVKLMTAMLVDGMDEQVAHTLDNHSTAELRELAATSLRLLADVKAKESGLSNE
jgi:hypothetical protein